MTMMTVITTDAHADVVYEPLIVDSGFNRDCIAESHPAASYAVSYLTASGTTYCFGTKSFIAEANAGRSGFTDEDFAIAKESGWPDDPTGDAENRNIYCILDAKDNPSYGSVWWQLAPYNEKNVLTLRPDGGNQNTGMLKFKKVGVYSRLYFLTVSAREGTVNEQRKVSAIIHYTTGEPDELEFSLATGLGGEEGHKVCMTNTLESSGYFIKNTNYGNKAQGKACASVFDMEVDKKRLIHRIEFRNDVVHSAAIILGVTGRTADIEAPAEEDIHEAVIADNSFQACWEAIAEAASYRIDVATDIDFQHILEDYNNKEVTGTTCKEIVNLISETDYYWRVRSVDADGGQSASSAPRQVKTLAHGAAPVVPSSSGTPEVTELEDPTIILDNIKGQGGQTLIVDRTLRKDGTFYTLCLPFDLASLDGTPLEGAEVFEFHGFTSDTPDMLNLNISQVNSMETGVPYLLRWSNTGETITQLVFNNITVPLDYTAKEAGDENIKFVGFFKPTHINDGANHSNLFLGANNKLFWPNNGNDPTAKMKGFRAYFKVITGGSNAPVRRGAFAQLVITPRPEITTATENSIATEKNCKLLENGQLVIMREGRRYNTLGQLIIDN